jgi:hypothetical protein
MFSDAPPRFWATHEMRSDAELPDPVFDKKRVEDTADQEFDQLSMLAAVQVPRFSSIAVGQRDVHTRLRRRS